MTEEYEGIPLHTDRSAWNVPLVSGGQPVGKIEHTKEVQNQSYFLHLPPLALGEVPMWDGEKVVGSLVATLNTLAEHAANPTAHQQLVSLSTALQAILVLTGQALSLQTQSPGLVLAGPESGSAAPPTFRTITPSDLSAILVGLSHITVSPTAPTSPELGDLWVEIA